MITVYLRSSSASTFDLCQQKYFISYVLGIEEPSNKKADIGTIVHSIAEELAKYKLSLQNMVGICTDAPLDVNHLVSEKYDYYTKKFSHHDWEPKDYITVQKLVQKLLTFQNGRFDPRNQNIFTAEQHFNITIDEEWAKYEFPYQGETLSGHLGLKGTIDLMVLDDEETLHIIDYKTGQRKNWKDGSEKTEAKLKDDFQLRLYHYVANKLYPQFKYIFVTIYYIQFDWPCTLVFEKDELDLTEQIIADTFRQIKETYNPSLKSDWFCKKLCHYGKSTFHDSHIRPLQEFRPGQVSRVGEYMTKCEQIRYMTDLWGIQEVTDKLSNPSHKISNYKAPGE